MKRRRTPSQKAARTAHNEIEVKVAVADRAAMRRRLLGLGARQLGFRVHEMNTLHDTAKETLRGSGRMLRIRLERPARRDGKAVATVTYKGPVRSRGASKADGYKVREERETRVLDGAAIAEIIAGIGLRPSFRYEKFRSTFRLSAAAGLKVELDETPIGDFLELEGNPDAIDRGARLLGFTRGDYITKSYGALYLEYLSRKRKRTARLKGVSPSARAMLFRAKRK